MIPGPSPDSVVSAVFVTFAITPSPKAAEDCSGTAGNVVSGPEDTGFKPFGAVVAFAELAGEVWLVEPDFLGVAWLVAVVAVWSGLVLEDEAPVVLEDDLWLEQAVPKNATSTQHPTSPI